MTRPDQDAWNLWRLHKVMQQICCIQIWLSRELFGRTSPEQKAHAGHNVKLAFRNSNS